MRTVNAHAPAISIRERYHNVAGDRWPVTVMPQPEELLSSWLHRLAYANGVPPKAFARVLGLSPGMWSAALDLKLPADIANLLHAKTGVAPDQLAVMTLSRDLPGQLLLPLRCNRHRDGSAWLQFCSRCLTEDAQPYFRRRWRLATRVSCTQHGCRLRDRCPSCNGCITVFDQAGLVPQHYCVACGYDLRRGPVPYISPTTRTLDRCIDNICSLEAIGHSPFGPALIRRLLNMPSAAGGYYTTMMLSSLSTAARTYCAERLSSPSEWSVDYTTDDEKDRKARRLRRSIPPTSDHSAWIELLANALGRRRGRPVVSEGNESGIKLLDLLGAYARMSPGPGRRLVQDLLGT
ncbi:MULTISPECIES: TniQ family protein [Rhizobium]|uniref:TniQ family protein n=1 Tax=Rhizobium TaxID=379 RepID=UPI001B344DC2|nr:MULTISPECIES: TniQ family protein [Rhizobium]MBX4910904.1 TniQ family protein [Rhizobium bangladeshense]MBX4949177.1 TniQ family protein [Rhizobium binae]MBX5177086.1 TniQ family protein [Rhizobium lentis]MBX5260020.1 TniQ family protein [Rhizobium sp. NLR16b]MBX5266112.1 TniQ family protein [Rhizobium sp. NLR16a]